MLYWIQKACRNVLGSYANDIFNRKHFLHSIPIEIDSKYEISFLLDECAKWNKDRASRFSNRFQIANELIKRLDKILLNFNFGLK